MFIDSIHSWGLCEPVSDRDLLYRNSFVLIACSFEELYLRSRIVSHCTLLDSVPDGSL